MIIYVLHIYWQAQLTPLRVIHFLFVGHFMTRPKNILAHLKELEASLFTNHFSK